MKESETLELKKSTSELKEAIISIAAMLNIQSSADDCLLPDGKKHGKGGLYFGIEDNGQVVGQGIGKMTIQDISKSIQDHIEPEIFPRIQEEQIEGKSCIRVKISGNQAPYFAYGRAYTRVGDKDLVLSSRELEGLFEKKNQGKLRWDDKPCLNAKLNDIDPRKLQAFLKKANLEPGSAGLSLGKLGLMLPDGSITNTAILLFARSPQAFFRYFGLRCAVFIGAATILDQKEFQGGLLDLIDNAQGYVMKNIHIGGRLEGLAMVDVPEIDPSALREAIINAFCHRDYDIPDTVDIAIYSDRVEIRSPGLLYGGLTIERILRGGQPERRNPLLAEILHRIHMVEKWGRGMKIILEKEPTVSFKEAGRHFITTFERKNVSEASKKVSETNVEKGRESTRKVSEKYQKILDVIRSEPNLSRAQLAKKLGLPSTTVFSRLRKLAKDGVLRRVGPDKGGHWEVIR